MTTELATITHATITPAQINPVRAYIKSVGESSRPCMEYSLRVCAALLTDIKNVDIETVPWQHLRIAHIKALRAALIAANGRDGKPYSPQTVNRHLSAVKGVLKSAWELELIDSDDYHRAVSVEGATGSRNKPGRYIEGAEIERLFAACTGATHEAPDCQSLRDRAILALLFGCGLRSVEICKLDVEDYNPSNGKVSVRAAKGNKDREVYVAGTTKAHVDAWLQERDTAPGPMFFRIWVNITTGKHEIVDTRITRGGLRHILLSRATRAGVTNLTLHDGRRTLLSNMLDNPDIPLATTVSWAGHAKPETTMSYDRRPELSKMAAAVAIQMPGVGK